MLNIKPTHHKISDTVRRIILVLVFVIVASVVIGYAGGYRLNFNNFSIEATGAISLSGSDTALTVKLNDRTVGASLPVYLNDLKPNQSYSISVQKDGYTKWSRTVTVLPNMVANFGPILLFRLEQAPIASTTADVTSWCKSNTPFGKQLVIDNSDIRIQKDFVTRVSAPVVNACWFNDGFHIAYATADEIHVIDNDGYNDVTVVTATTPIQQMGVNTKDSEIDYFDGTNWYKLNI
ncbi:MAG: PEGA domain-containing protein [Patescibacteria group bacterium]|jgi:hypothetical protein